VFPRCGASRAVVVQPLTLTGAMRMIARITGGLEMAESVYKVVELVGTSTDSWERAAAAAIERAGQTLRDLRIAQVVEQDVVLEGGKVQAYRTKLKVSFKYEG
jgi:flavin-binding protein dodecin